MPYSQTRTYVNTENIIIDFFRGNYTTDEIPRVVSELPANFPFPTLQIVRTNGVSSDSFMAVDSPIMSVDVWHNDRDLSFTLANDVRSILKNLIGSKIGDSGSVLVNMKEIVGPRWLPDPDDNVKRIGATYQLDIKNF